MDGLNYHIKLDDPLAVALRRLQPWNRALTEHRDRACQKHPELVAAEKEYQDRRLQLAAAGYLCMDERIQAGQLEREMAELLTLSFGAPQKSDRSSALYFTLPNGRLLRLADHSPIYSRSVENVCFMLVLGDSAIESPSTIAINSGWVHPKLLATEIVRKLQKERV